jgi:hypothetical protein
VILFACCAIAFLAIYLALRRRQSPRPPVQWGWLSMILALALLALVSGLVL